jgi:cell division septum initiation protein DivIVA
MEGSVSNVQFTERKRGFDPDEVANYLAHIDDKIAGLRSIAAEAIARAEQAEERARAAEQRVAAAEEGPAQAAGVLAMAQQTADATVAQARAEAEAQLASAREDADRQRLSAEAEAQQLLADTRRDLEIRRSEHLDTLRREIDDLVETRDGVIAEVTALEEHLAAQRARVLEARDALTLLAEDPGALAGVDTPTVTEVAAWAEDAAPWDEGVVGSAEDGGEDIVVAVDEFAVGDVVVDDIVVSDPATGAVVEDIVVSDAATGEVVGEAVIVDTVAAGPADLPWGSGDPDATAPVSAVGGLFDDDAVDDLDGPAAGAVGPAPLGGGVGEAEEAGGLFGDEPAGGTAFGAYDDEDDEAMRAFFESDVDDAERPGRWGFRRR